jgi:isopropylmalate/homocitrate/citramalate synthase
MPPAETFKLWETSPFADRAAKGLLAFAPKIRFSDCTLRDGEQQAGIVFTGADKLKIARALDAAGIYEIEAGTPASSAEDCDAVAAIARDGLRAKVSALARARKDDVDLVAKTGAWGVRLSLPISPIQRASKIKLDDEQYLALAREITGYSKEHGLNVIFSPYDTTRCELDFLKRLLETLQRDQTVDRVRLVDTTGCATPHVVRFLVKEMQAAADIPIEIHCHNDCGLGVANTIAGAEAGAEYLSVTVNGIGERSGNAALEETALALRALYGVDTGLDLAKLTELSRLVEELSGVALQAHKPVVGRGAFAHESGMVVAGLLKDPFTAECYRPELVGQRREIVIGKKAGLASVEAKLRELGIDATRDDLLHLLEAVKAKAIATKRPLATAEFKQLAVSVVGTSRAGNGEKGKNHVVD